MGLVSVFETLRSRISAAWAALDIRDFFIFGGLALMGAGFWEIAPWMSMIVIGALLFCMGKPFIGRGKK